MTSRGPEIGAAATGAAPRLSVIACLRNAEAIIDRVYPLIVAGCARWTGGCEIILVDDGSTDGTRRRMEALQRADPRVRVVALRSSFGESAALQAGMEWARGEVVAILIGRVNANPAGLGALLAALERGSDLVVGWRSPRRDSPWNRAVSRAFNLLAGWAAGMRLHDLNSGVLVARREVLASLPLYGDLNKFLPILAARQGYRVVEERIEQLPGEFAFSLYPQDYLSRLLDLVTVTFLTRYSKKPLHFLGFLGIIFALAGGAISIYLFIYRITGQGGIAGRPLLLLGVLLLLIGIQMISIGLIGEMIIFVHAREIKEYSIAEVLGGGEDDAQGGSEG